MPACPNCGSTDCEEIDDFTFACLDCEYIFNFEGGEPEEQALEPVGLDDDMQGFEDRISPLGDES
jgi:hypothetical protein